MAKHKHYECIVAWAEGKTIQARVKDGEWKTLTYQPEWLLHCEYRVKPETVKYRKFLWRSHEGTMYVLIVHPEDQLREPREKWTRFVRWIDNDWQELEI